MSISLARKIRIREIKDGSNHPCPDINGGALYTGTELIFSARIVLESELPPIITHGSNLSRSIFDAHDRRTVSIPVPRPNGMTTHATRILMLNSRSLVDWVHGA